MIKGVKCIDGYLEYIGGCSVHQKDVMNTSEGCHECIMS